MKSRRLCQPDTY